MDRIRVASLPGLPLHAQSNTLSSFYCVLRCACGGGGEGEGEEEEERTGEELGTRVGSGDQIMVLFPAFQLFK